MSLCPLVFNEDWSCEGAVPVHAISAWNSRKNGPKVSSGGR